ncbi:MAG: SufD family Fe-S cluster assembly protein, partial [Planctomycetales bacterium]
MTQTTIQQGFSDATFDAFLASRSEPDWATDLRRRAWDAHNSLPAPSPAQEEWRRVEIRGLNFNKFNFPLEIGESLAAEPLLSHGVELAGQAVSLDSRPTETRLDREWADQGVVFGPIEDCLRTHGDLIQEHFQSAVEPGTDRFSALHAAAWSGGVFLYVPPGVKITQPLHQCSSMTAGGSDFSHVLAVLDEGAEAVLMSETVGGESGFHDGAVELILKPKARLRYVNLQNWDVSAWHFARHNALLHQDAQLQWTVGALGARTAKVNQHVELMGSGSKAQVNGVMFTEGRQQSAYHTLQRHRSPNATSDLLYKGALQDHSRMVWRGMIQVDPGAIKTNGYQRNDNLMLSEHARADSIPGLEIEAD